ERAAARGLISSDESASQLSDLLRATKMLSGLIRFRRNQLASIHESAANYAADHPAIADLTPPDSDTHDPFDG
ncbi:MAG TPA: hypothetical protein VFJ58_15090, partial [Armatimonadota bacterium]|nr:hypothetical protein [Armatimonadota bacterium]